VIVIIEDQSWYGFGEIRHCPSSRLRVGECPILEVATDESIAGEKICRVIGCDDEVGEKYHHAIPGIRVNAAAGL
jgi:hypothetical protein